MTTQACIRQSRPSDASNAVSTSRATSRRLNQHSLWPRSSRGSTALVAEVEEVNPEANRGEEAMHVSLQHRLTVQSDLLWRSVDILALKVHGEVAGEKILDPGSSSGGKAEALAFHRQILSAGFAVVELGVGHAKTAEGVRAKAAIPHGQLAAELQENGGNGVFAD